MNFDQAIYTVKIFLAQVEFFRHFDVSFGPSIVTAPTHNHTEHRCPRESAHSVHKQWQGEVAAHEGPLEVSLPPPDVAHEPDSQGAAKGGEEEAQPAQVHAEVLLVGDGRGDDGAEHVADGWEKREKIYFKIKRHNCCTVHHKFGLSSIW